MKKIAFILALFFASSGPAFAHKPSNSYLEIENAGSAWQLRWDIALRDLETAIGLDRDQNGRLTGAEVEGQAEAISAYALARLEITDGSSPCAANPESFEIRRLGDGNHASLSISAVCPVAGKLELRYSLFFDFDPTHRGLVSVRDHDRSSSHVFSESRRKLALDLRARSDWAALGEFVVQGVWHIWIGFDHILFLLTLLLPSVLCRENGVWRPARRLNGVFLDTLKIVTAFTLAHSITLTLASLQIVTLPSRFVESMIAFSVIVTALNNLVPLFRGFRWGAAFGFGLIHGFGFANVLHELGLQGSQMALSLLGFNIGVELGQLVIVAAFVPLAYLIRGTGYYRWGVLRAGSAAVTILATGWLLERLFDYRLIEIF